MIKPYERNPRQNEGAIDAVARSIREFGFRQPLVVDEGGVIIVGHVRFLAAHKLGLKTVPVHVARGLTPEQARAYRIADNQTADLSDWDYDLLPVELADLRAADFDLALLGFDPDELARLLDPGVAEGLTDPDFVPEPPDEPVTRPGDLWRLGRHRLLCGDAANPEHVDRLLDGAAVHLVNTDPPYNVKLEPRSNNAIAAGLAGGKGRDARAHDGRRRTRLHHQALDVARDSTKARPTHQKLRPKDRPLANHFVPAADFAALLAAWFGQIERVLVPGGVFYLWGGYDNIFNYPAALERAGLRFSQTIIWVKSHPVLTRKDFLGDHEWCFYGWKKGRHRFYGPRNVRDVWELRPRGGARGTIGIGRGVRLQAADGSPIDLMPPDPDARLETASVGDAGVVLFGVDQATDVWHVRKIAPQQMLHLTEKPVELARRALRYSSRPGQNVLDLFGGSGSTLIAAEQTERNAFLVELDPLYCDVIVQRWEGFTAAKAVRLSAKSPYGCTGVRARRGH